MPGDVEAVEAVCVSEAMVFAIMLLLAAAIFFLPDDIFDFSATGIISPVCGGHGGTGTTGTTVRHIRMTIIRWATRRRRSIIEITSRGITCAPLSAAGMLAGGHHTRIRCRS